MLQTTLQKRWYTVAEVTTVLGPWLSKRRFGASPGLIPRRKPPPVALHPPSCVLAPLMLVALGSF
jgi:hypothetical protein